MRSFPFSQTLSRSGTGSIKWEKYSGKEVLPMWVADMELATSDQILAAMKDRLEHPILGYTTATENLKIAVTNYLEQHHQWQIDPDWLVWLPGVVPGLSALTSLLSPEDQIMVFTPVYHPLLLIPERYQHTRVDVPLLYDNHRWHIDFDAFERSINAHCRMLFLCSPHNPVGTLFTEQELTRLAEICHANDILLISDEIHCDLVLDTQRKHVATGRIAGDSVNNLITLMSPSKTFNLAGANCSFAVIPDANIRDTYRSRAMYTLPIVPTLSYTAAEAAYTLGWPWHAELIDYLRDNLATLHSAIQDTPLLTMDPPEATYLAWINTEALPVDDAYEFFLEAGVGLSPGAQFGDSRYQRLNFACSREQLETGIDRIRQAVAAIT